MTRQIPIEFDCNEDELYQFTVCAAGARPLDVSNFEAELVKWFMSARGELPEFSQDRFGNRTFIITGIDAMLAFQEAFAIDNLTPDRIS